MDNSIQEEISTIFLKSLSSDYNKFIKTEEILGWVKDRNSSVSVNVSQIPLSDLSEWIIEKDFSEIYHKSKHFFSIKGLKVNTNFGVINSWSQPIIDQPEIGILGFLTKEFDGVLYFLVQAKIEPGNINSVQISPTLQATKSNYTQKHKGSLPKYLNYFLNHSRHKVLYDQLQSEQGARFFKKQNRNIIIKTDEKIDLEEDFMWLTLAQIKKLSMYNNTINMDTRTVVSCINYKNKNFLKSLNNANETIEKILSWINKLKKQFILKTEIVPLLQLPEWEINNNEIKRYDKRFFKVIGADIKIENREVKNWQQPLVKPMSKGIVALFMKKIKNKNHYLVHAKVECGHSDIVELGPSISLSNGEVNKSKDLQNLLDIIKEERYEDIIFDTLQSEEGGRFFHEENRNILVQMDNDFDLIDNELFKWITLDQLLFLLNDSNIINIQLRSLISLINEEK